MKDFFITLGIITGVFIIWYIIARLISDLVVLKTKLAPGDKEITADQYYYLPGASMTITANLTLVVSRSFISGHIVDVSQSMDLETQTQLEPDTDQLLILNYIKDFYSNDEIRIKTSADALIENVSVITEDRISNIISQLTANVPKAAVDALVQMDLNARAEDPLVKETLTFSKTFKISVKELKKETITCRWIVPIDNKQAAPTLWNASFSVRNESMKDVLTLNSGFSFNGLVSRPLQNKTWNVHFPENPFQTDEASQKFNDQAGNSFSAMIPDPNRITKIPIKRNLFVKKSQTPGFTKGLLTENYFNKPSEFEAFVSIPVNIAKAIVSIPSAMLQFKITNLKKELDLEKAKAELQKLKDPPPPEPAAALKDPGTEDLQKKLKTLEAALKEFKEKTPAQEDVVPKLGKLPAEEQSQPVARLKDIQQDLLNRGELRAEDIATVPESRFWHSRFTGEWMSYNNEHVMNCVPAAAAHMIMCWTCNTKENITRLSLQQVMDAYIRESGFDPATGANDKGCATLSFLRRWKNPGLSPNKIRDFVGLRKSDAEELKFAINVFGACMVGFKMPNSAKKQKDAWEITDPDNQLGEWGPHAVAAVGYDKDILLVVSWGRLIQVKWDFYKKYNDEGFSVLTDDWLKEGKSPGGNDFAMLKTLFENLA